MKNIPKAFIFIGRSGCGKGTQADLLMAHLSEKHKDITNNYELIKSRHLDGLATKMLKNDEKMSKLREKNINTNFLDLF